MCRAVTFPKGRKSEARLKKQAQAMQLELDELKGVNLKISAEKEALCQELEQMKRRLFVFWKYTSPRLVHEDGRTHLPCPRRFLQREQ